MSGLVSRLEAVASREMKRRLSGATSGSVDQAGFDELLLVYGNWRARVPEARPRVVHCASALRADPKASVFEEAIGAIRERLERGHDLTPHLSISVTTLMSAEGPDRGGLDRLLSDWGIHHLHLSLEPHPRNPMFFARTQYLLFAAITDHAAYLLAVLDHGHWTDRQLVEVITREWPEEGLLTPSRTAIGLTATFDESEHLEMREAGITVAMEIDGRVWSPPGMTAMGTPMGVGRAIMKLRAQLAEWREDTAARLDAVRTRAPGAVWLPVVVGENLGFTDGSAVVTIGSLPRA